ncbi:exonuclease 1 isoform X2 [Electrophorus electricus]|uniref:exonuclease 1 isoform X2 n=1 Tax=Electrophorus electricus TaxID=8005 RepID=UPI0015D080C0|nr:exonuclease 1 isoform X2 [Electrophorus electricus]
MGIPGLLQFLKDAWEPVHVGTYRGHTLAVDTYCWMHKGAFSCAEKLAKGEPTDQYVKFCMRLVDMLLSFGVQPLLVFDGRNLPSKQHVEEARRERRQSNLQKGKQLLRAGKTAEARECFSRAVSITPSMAHEVIKVARARGVDCLVAPYEADAQLAFLNKAGIAQAVITEDSDLLAFGCKKVILKMDKQGNGLEIDQCHLGRCRSLGDVFTEEKFRHMCILSGCDYLASLHGIGLGKACKLLKMANNPDILKVIKKMGQYLKMNISVPDEYIEGFVKANNTFLYQIVFDPIRRKVVPLNPYPDHVDPAALRYAGVNIGDQQGLQMALGNLDLNTLEKIDNFSPDAPPAQPSKAPPSRGWGDGRVLSARTVGSIWSRGYVPGTTEPQTPASPITPPPTWGKARMVAMQGLKLQVKRPREDCSMSEENVLDQYLSIPKRHCTQTPPCQAPPTTQADRTIPKEVRGVEGGRPRPCNRFATLLQWRNQPEESDGEWGTRSRFFASEDPCLPVLGSKSSDAPSPDRDLSLESQAAHRRSEGPWPPVSPPSLPPSQSLGAFSCTGGSSSNGPVLSSVSSDCCCDPGLSALHQFLRKKEGLSWVGSPQRALPSPPLQGADDIDTPPGSPPSQDSAYFSQPTSGPSSLEDSPTSSPITPEVPEKEKDTWRDSECSATPNRPPVVREVRPLALRTKVSGLSRTRPAEWDGLRKVRPSGPARASGLRRNPSVPGKRSAMTNENSSGLQATISGLWKTFSFRKENPKLTPHKKAEPMSPVKDNLPAC